MADLNGAVAFAWRTMVPARATSLQNAARKDMDQQQASVLLRGDPFGW
jgi:hypothetical protein